MGIEPIYIAIAVKSERNTLFIFNPNLTFLQTNPSLDRPW
jgi:hypothetical protein